jgi:hypothetical protein
MSQILIALSASVLMLAGCTDERPRDASVEPSTGDIKAAREAASLLGQSLKSRLVSVMSTEGPEAAVNVCAKEAHSIADDISKRTGLEVGRTALRVRNVKSAPDDYERAQLKRFLAAAARGENAAAMEAVDVMLIDGAPYMRYMKPIIMDGPCVICHGEAIAPTLKATINAVYPDDKAVGFPIGEIRGAFTVVKRLQD